jgi:DNA invertase Pin-like site-specific DNA recombinase
MTTVWALLVVSSEAQAETLPHQRAWAERVSTENGWRLARVIEGVASGKEGPRRLSRDVLLEVRATPPEARPAYLLMIRLDRVGRGSIVDSQLFVRDLLALGARVFTRDAGEIRLDSAMDELVAAVQMAVARHENDVRRDKMRAVYKRRKDAGVVVSNRAPFGLTITAERAFAALPSHRKTVRKAFAMRAAGERVVDIVRWLNAHSPPHRFKNGNVYRVRWTDRRLAVMLAHRGYVGTMVDEPTWLGAQRDRLERYVGKSPRRERKHGQFVLAGVLRCACGHGISAVASINGAKTNYNRYYVCKAAWSHGGWWRYHRAGDLEARFEAFLGRLADDTLARPPRIGSAAMLERMTRHVTTLRASLDVVDRARARVWALDDAGHLDSRDLAERLAALNARKAEVEAQLVHALEERSLVEVARLREVELTNLHRDGLARYRAADFAGRAALGRTIAASFGGLRITKAGTILVGARPGYVWQRKKKASEI